MTRQRRRRTRYRSHLTAFTITGPLTADLLAVKIQDADELVYRLAVSCTDGAGNTSQPAAINVIVPHDQGKGEQH